MTKTERIRDLNDRLRRTGQGGQIMTTPGGRSLDEKARASRIHQVRTFSEGVADNDPYGEHDFGSVDVAGERFFWKIDYYDPTLSLGSEDPSDPEKTARVLTLMRADEY